MSRSAPWRVRLNAKIPARLQRHGRAVAAKIKFALEELQAAPQSGKILKNFQNVRSLPVTTPSGEFRVIYRLVPSEKIILVDLIDTREQVYKLLKRGRR